MGQGTPRSIFSPSRENLMFGMKIQAQVGHLRLPVLTTERAHQRVRTHWQILCGAIVLEKSDATRHECFAPCGG